jgi:hypothetical protein
VLRGLPERKRIESFKTYDAGEVTARAIGAKPELSGWAPEPHDGYSPRALLLHADPADVPSVGSTSASRSFGRACSDV